jgi:hypothetical protein
VDRILGCSVGTGEAASVGVTVGSRVDVTTGLFVGASVSIEMGVSELDTTVGTWLGATDSLCSGAEVGVLAWLGIFVGAGEEASVGDSVGALVVASEGACDVAVDGDWVTIELGT